jgi:hypothetical protein
MFDTQRECARHLRPTSAAIAFSSSSSDGLSHLGRPVRPLQEISDEGVVIRQWYSLGNRILSFEDFETVWQNGIDFVVTR